MAAECCDPSVEYSRCSNGKASLGGTCTGHVAVLQWAKENGCEWDEATTHCAVIYGHAGTLDYAIKNGCEWKEEPIQMAMTILGQGCIPILQVARAHGWGWAPLVNDNGVDGADAWPDEFSRQTCLRVASYQRFNVLQWMVTNGCPWDLQECAKVTKDLADERAVVHQQQLRADDRRDDDEEDPYDISANGADASEREFYDWMQDAAAKMRAVELAESTAKAAHVAAREAERAVATAQDAVDLARRSMPSA